MGADTHYLPARGHLLLNQCCWLINKAYDNGGYGCFLVGSALAKPDYRDVDVRLILSDEAFARTFATYPEHPHLDPLWSVTCTSLSLFLQHHTGLPVDFQIQSMTESGKEPDKRHPLGVFMLPTPRDYAATMFRGAHVSDPATSGGGEAGPVESEP